MPAIGAVSLRVYENTVVRQTEAELVAQGAALAAMAALQWPGAAPPTPRPAKPPEGYYQPEPTSIDLTLDPVLPVRPPPRKTTRTPSPEAEAVAHALGPVIDRTVRTTLASVLVLDRQGLVVYGGPPGDYSRLPEVRWALAGRPHTVFRENGDYEQASPLEWLSKASALRLHHARPIVVDGKVQGVLLLSRSPRALFRGIYEDRGQWALVAVVILGMVVVISGLVSRGVTRPIYALSAASKRVAAGLSGEIPETPGMAAVEVQDLYEDFRVMAERIERRSGYLRDFAAAVSHEFKTPLAGIKGAVELLQDHFETMSPEERRRFLDNIAGDSERLSQLVTRLLDLARADMATPEAGVATPLPALVARVAAAESAPGFRVDVRLPDDLPEVAAPATTVESALTILLQNSRQAGASCAVAAAEAAGGEVVITVRDDGPGVAEADRERMFEPFFTSRRAAGGTGLGLPIARSLLAASQGRLELADPGPGAVFRIVLPRAP